MTLYEQDASDDLDYQMNWADWLGTDTISTSTWTVPAGITQSTPATNTTTTATVWLSGGTAGRTYTIANKIVTAGGRTAERSFQVKVTNL